MVAAACLTLAAVHGVVWWWRRGRAASARANLLFAASAVATALLAAGELSMMRAGTPEEFATAVRWSHVPTWLLVGSLVGFVRVFLCAGHPGLGWTVVGVRTGSLALNFLTGVNLNYREITSLRHVAFLGEPVSVGVGVLNPWMLVGQLSLVLLVVFVTDAALTVWRRGERRLAAVVGGGIVLCVLLGTTQAILVFWAVVPMPITASLFYLGIVAAMGLELSRDLLRAAELAEERQRAQLETARLRQELAHAGRVTMLGQLASALAHELNQPLGAILRNAEAAELLLQRRPVADLDEVRVILADIRQDDQRAGAVIDRMRALLRRHVLATLPLDVAELVGEVATLVRADAEVRGMRLAVRVPGGLPPVSGDRVHLQQVLLNLILNGLDAMAGTGEETAARLLTVSARSDANGTSVEIAVRDHGTGLPADRLAHVFDPFFTTKPEGLGMGLAISRTIVEAHGGRLWAENHPGGNDGDDDDGGGATFRFTLPVSEGNVPS